ncbi:hypothetical protein J6590_087728 [Homalodisca vitripennis]|nr:hypothetical protein J6590_087728 [Homalodisca vitripennis]
MLEVMIRTLSHPVSEASLNHVHSVQGDITCSGAVLKSVRQSDETGLVETESSDNGDTNDNFQKVLSRKSKALPSHLKTLGTKTTGERKLTVASVKKKWVFVSRLDVRDCQYHLESRVWEEGILVKEFVFPKRYQKDFLVHKRLGLASPNLSKSLSDVSNIIDFKSVDTFNAKILYLNAQSSMDKRDISVRNMYKSELKKAKLRANETLINSASNPCKAAWSIIAEVSSPTTSSAPNISPEAFSDFFVDTMKEVRQNITPSNSSADDLLSQAPRTTNSFKWNPTQ